MSRIFGRLASVSLVVAASLIPLQSAHAAGATDFPAHYTAPYVETWGSPSVIADAESATGLRYFTLAFVLDSGGCHASYNGNVDITDSGWMTAIDNLRNSGGDVIASFGGASGTELATSCSSVSALQAQYQYVIDTLHLTRVDFDIEGAPLDDAAANDRRNKALAALQQYYAGQGRTLAVDYTLPVARDGLQQDGIDLLDNAKADGVDVNVVNVMTMDYGGAVSDMGQAAIDAATALHSQLGQIWGSSPWSMVGITPMIGVNDSAGETFTLDNATAVKDFADSNGVQELSYWVLGRDKACATTGTLSDSCSGVAQSPYQFASILLG